MLKLFQAAGALSNIRMGEVAPADVVKIAKAFDFEVGEDQVASILQVLNQQEFEGSVAEFFQSGQWLNLLKTEGRTSLPQLIQCRHCGGPMYL